MAKKSLPQKTEDKKKSEASCPAVVQDPSPKSKTLLTLQDKMKRCGLPPRIVLTKDEADQFQLSIPTENKNDYRALVQTSGSLSADFISRHVNQLINIAINLEQDPSKATKTANALLGAVHGIEPQNEMETLLAAQMAATQALAMEMLARAAHASSADIGVALVNSSTKLLRTFTAQFEALTRSRGRKTEQRVVVEHVHVEAGGQAVVGAVQTPGVGGKDEN